MIFNSNSHLWCCKNFKKSSNTPKNKILFKALSHQPETLLLVSLSDSLYQVTDSTQIKKKFSQYKLSHIMLQFIQQVGMGLLNQLFLLIYYMSIIYVCCTQCKMHILFDILFLLQYITLIKFAPSFSAIINYCLAPLMCKTFQITFHHI